MKSILISVSLLFLFCASVLAEDVLIIHQNYGNTHSKHKNRLENAGHTVTMQNTSSSYSYTASNYDQVYDIRYSYTSYSTADKDRFKTVLSNGGTVYLVGENGNFDARNNAIVSFLQEVTGDNTISHSGNSCCGSGAKYSMNENRTILTSYSTSNDMTVVASGYFDDIGTNGKWLLKDPNDSNKVVAAMWDGDAMSSYTNGKVVVILDINYASHSSYYTNGDQAWIDAMISDVLVSTVNTRSVTLSGISSSQTTEFNTFRNKSVNGNQIYITQTGDNNVLNILQDGDDNLIIGTDLTSAGVITGDNNNVDIDQIGSDNVLGIDIVGSTNDVDVTQNQDQRAKLNITGSSNTANLNQSAINNVGEHYMSVIIAGNNNTLDLDQTETGNKKLFLDIDGSNNVTVDQKGTGNHYSEITLTDSHTVDVTQDGSGDHNATINLSGNTSSVTLTQDSSTSQNYYLYQNCSQTSCSATVTQN
tara:strand:- start:363 stop:1787 length:1425 start_codon:yes stop_codon:yes gene_type:complete